MSNRVSLIRTEFRDYLGVSYGWRICDDEGQSYCNMFDAPVAADDLELLKLVSEHADEVTSAILDWAEEHGMYIDGDWKTAEQARKLVQRARAI